MLDAQYFGVAQRRKRVFLVASGGDDLDPAEVLLSAQACSGILVRAARRGKKLPALLDLVLTQQADMQD